MTEIVEAGKQVAYCCGKDDNFLVVVVGCMDRVVMKTQTQSRKEELQSSIGFGNDLPLERLALLIAHHKKTKD